MRINQKLIFMLALLLAASISAVLVAQNPPPAGKAYRTPEKALEAFIDAARNYNIRKLVAVFGEDAKRLFESVDPVADTNMRATFLAYFDEKHSFIDQDETTKMLVVGNHDWPFPIPLVKTSRGWQWDTVPGYEEIINRRIGNNELDAIQTLLAIGDAQREYYGADHDGDGILEYAQTFRSTIGLRNGLFWPVEEGEKPSPLGPFVANAANEGYTAASTAFHGYHFRPLAAQGPSAPGGAYEYTVHGHQIGGFAVLAYPSAYGDSGIMTFVMNHDGVVYQKDLGAETASEVLKIARFDPAEGWTKVPDKDLQPVN
jgi:hypothetical protein